MDSQNQPKNVRQRQQTLQSFFGPPAKIRKEVADETAVVVEADSTDVCPRSSSSCDNNEKASGEGVLSSVTLDSAFEVTGVGDLDASSSAAAACGDEFQQNDIGQYLTQTQPTGSAPEKRILDEKAKHDLLVSPWTPPKNYVFPFSLQGNKKRYMNGKYLELHDWLVFSPSAKGLFCKYCFLFTFGTSGGGPHKATPLGNLVRSSLKNLKDLGGEKGDLNSHSRHQYHIRAVQDGKNFLETYGKPEKEIVNQISSQRLKNVEENRARLKPIVKTILFCGRNNLPLRGHRDDGPLLQPNPKTQTDGVVSGNAGDGDISSIVQQEGVFRRLLKFRIDSGDSTLAEHLRNSSSRSTYISKTCQEDLIRCCGQEISDEILRRVQEAEMYSVLFDETPDKAGLSQISIVLRYKYKNTIREDFVEFVCAFDEAGRLLKKVISDQIEEDDTVPEADGDGERAPNKQQHQEVSLTGEALGKIVVDHLQNHYHLDLKKCVGIGTDGCSVMVSELRGAVAEIQKVAINAEKCTCFSHRLNNSLSKSNSVPDVKKDVSTMKDCTSFFHYPKRRFVLMDILGCPLTTLCETRWVERHDSVLQYGSDLPQIIAALSEIAGWKDTTAANNAKSLIWSVTESPFIMSVLCLGDILSLTKPLSEFLQKRDLDLSKASETVSSVIRTLEERRRNCEEHFEKIWEQANALIQKFDMDPKPELEIPWFCARQRHRANYPTTLTKDYYRQAIYVPLLDNVINDLKDRFPDESLNVYSLPFLLPEKIVTTDVKDISPLSETLWNHFYRLLPVDASIGEQSLKNEIFVWREACLFRKDKENPPGDQAKKKQETPKIPEILTALSCCDPDVYPLVSTLLKLLATLPVSNSTAERAFSTLRRLKTWLRATMEEPRLVGLALLNIHQDVEVSVDRVIDRHAKSGNRRLEFVL